MNKYRLSALALAGAMVLALAACGSKGTDATPTPGPTETPNVVESVKPTETLEATPEPEPSESVNVVTPPAETDAVVKPLESQAPDKGSELAPSPAPSEAPAAGLTAADVYAKVSAAAGGNPMSDVGFVLEEFYNLSVDDLEDFAFYMPEMSATTEEIFIAKVKSGKLDGVKSACESRQQGMKEDAAMYPSAAEYVEGSKIVTNGDWIMFAVVAEPDAAVTAFNGCF